MTRLRTLFMLVILLAMAIPAGTPAQAQNRCGNHYVVVSGDTLIEIAVRCGVSLAGILDANPQIIDPDQIYPGWSITIPYEKSIQPIQPILSLSPTCGPSGSTLTVRGSNFPVRMPVGIGLGKKDQAYNLLTSISSGTLGRLETQVTIPTTSAAGDQWEVILLTLKGEPVLQLVSEPFTVIETNGAASSQEDCNPPPVPAPTTYTTRPGDNLDRIAAQFGISPASLLALNPLVTNSDQLTNGEKLIVPPLGQGPIAILSPVSAPPGAQATIEGLGFPANTTVTLGLGLWRSDFTIAGSASTTSYGWFTTPITIPLSATENQRWAVTINLAATPGESAGFAPVVTNPLTIKQTVPTDQPIVTIYPLSGPPGTSLYVVGAGFPKNAEITLSFGQEGLAVESVTTVYSDINGTFQAEATIPDNGITGVAWLASASTTITVDKQVIEITASSEPFSVTSGVP